MAVVAEACLAESGRVIGVLPKCMAEQHFARHNVSALHVVGSMHARNALMAKVAEAFMGLPGGYGTPAACCEMITWPQRRIQPNPCGLFNVKGVFESFLTLVRSAAPFPLLPSALFLLPFVFESFLTLVRSAAAGRVYRPGASCVGQRSLCSGDTARSVRASRHAESRLSRAAFLRRKQPRLVLDGHWA